MTPTLHSKAEVAGAELNTVSTDSAYTTHPSPALAKRAEGDRERESATLDTREQAGRSRPRGPRAGEAGKDPTQPRSPSGDFGVSRE